MDKPECGIESKELVIVDDGTDSQKMDKPECGIERSLTPLGTLHWRASEDG